MKKLIVTTVFALSFAMNAQKIMLVNTADILKKDHTHWISVVHFGYYGFVDDAGKEIVPPIYESIDAFGDYQKNWARVAKDGLYGFIDEKGENIVKPIYEDIGKFGIYKEDWALVFRDGFYGFINREGREIVEAKYDQVPPIKR